jgi:hypothetical protein
VPRPRKSVAPTVHDEDVKPLSLPKDLVQVVIAPPGTEPEPEPEHKRSLNHLSFSQLSTYLRCSYQYWFAYILNLKERPKVSLALGSGGHAALEFNTKFKIQRKHDAPEEYFLDVMSSQMDRELTAVPFSEYEKDAEPGGLKDKFIGAGRVYHRRDAPTIHPIAAEYPFMLDMNQYLPENEEPIKLVRGYIDLVYDPMGKFLGDPSQIRVGVEDYKFVTRKKSQSEVNLSPQLTTYAAAMHQKTGKYVTEVGFRQMHPGTQKDGPDSIVLQREPELMTPQALEGRMKRIAFQFARMQAAVKADIFVPTDDPITCSWCGYRDRCQKSLVTDMEAASIRATNAPPM